MNVMMTAHNLLYSNRAIARILGVATSAVLKFEVYAQVVWVHVQGQRPTFLSKRLFKTHFVEHRKQSAQELKAICQGDFWIVHNPGKASQYLVVPERDRVECNCGDYANQRQCFGRGLCKHGQKVLHELGFASLHDYITAAA
jgi:hypothetical protein